MLCIIINFAHRNTLWNLRPTVHPSTTLPYSLSNRWVFCNKKSYTISNKAVDTKSTFQYTCPSTESLQYAYRMNPDLHTRNKEDQELCGYHTNLFMGSYPWHNPQITSRQPWYENINLLTVPSHVGWRGDTDYKTIIKASLLTICWIIHFLGYSIPTNIFIIFTS